MVHGMYQVNRNGSVMAYIREICGLTELVIAGKNGICANENCSTVICGI